MLLDKINKPNDIKKIRPADYDALAEEIREFLLEKVSHTGGHLASSLGVVELTMALHLTLNLPKDKIIWDVGHQAYTHKILTGRKDGFDNLRCLGGMSGFPNKAESPCDVFTTGHSSTSISTGLGLAEARDMLGENYHVVSVIGDGALTGGMAYEALNNAGRLKSNMIIILNDNNMSISENIGSVSRMMTSIRTAPSYNAMKKGVASAIEKLPNGDNLMERLRSTKSSFKQLFIPGMFFENLGLTYLGPVDGYNIKEMIHYINSAKRMDSPVVIHVMTKKGKGYGPAEKNPSYFHGIGKFDIKTGESVSKKTPDYSKIAGGMLSKIAEKNPKICCISAAMIDGVGLKGFATKFPDRIFDVGIAEEHAVTFAAGLAAGGLKPFVCIYSSFLQRAYDQIIHDVCLQKLPVTFMIDRAGIVGADGETHQGILDIAFLTSIPGMTVMAPKNAYELAAAIRFAEKFDGPLAIRYPRGEAYRGLEEIKTPIELGKAEVLIKGSKEKRGIALFALGTCVKRGYEVAKMLEKDGTSVTLVNARFAKPFDKDMIRDLCSYNDAVFVLEEGVQSGGLAEHISAYAESEALEATIIPITLPDDYIEHGDTDKLLEMLGLDTKGLYNKITEAYKKIKEK